MKKITHEKIVSLIKSVDIKDSPTVSIDSIATTMERYASELELFNKAYDLVGSDDFDSIITRHIMDSLTAVPAMQNLFQNIANKEFQGDILKITVADVGSGAGFPGIPLAVSFPQIQFTLIERMKKRCTFLESCIAMLQLKNVQVVCKEVERVTPQSFDVVTFRAFRPLEADIILALLRITKQNGNLAAYKAKLKKIEEEMASLKELSLQWTAVPLTCDFLGDGEESRERNLVIISK